MKSMTDETIEREIHSSEGCNVKVKSKRGTGTRDQDEVTVEVSATDPMDVHDLGDVAVAETAAIMNARRVENDVEDDDA